MLEKSRAYHDSFMRTAPDGTEYFDKVSYAEDQARRANEQPGTENLKDGYDCPKCLNRTMFNRASEDGTLYVEWCDCREARRSLITIRNSGLQDAIDRLTFDSFKDDEPYQKIMKSTARRYVEAVKDGSSDWLFISGQSGCGKTHVCTAACGELLHSGTAVKYLMWAEDTPKIKATVNDEEEYTRLTEPLLNVRVLYIDDLFKSPNPEGRHRAPNPTDADARLAYTIINGRVARNLPTIISCEYTIDPDLIGVDAATFWRVYEKAKDGKFLMNVKNEPGRNYRRKTQEEI